MQNNLDKLLSKVIGLIEKEGLGYFLIGGLAAGFLGEPRMTQDIDLILFIDKLAMHKFLTVVKKAGFKFNKKIVLDDVKARGSFKLIYDNLWVDIIIASTEFEQSALKRRGEVEFLGKKLKIPSVEDFILLKVVPGRDKDILDVKAVIERHKGKIDKKYLENWAQRLSDEAQDLRIWNLIKSII